MIEITLNQALLLYSVVLGIGFLVLLLYAEIKVQRTAERLEKQHLWRCTICTYTYLDQPGVDRSRCPRCNSVNTLEDKDAKLVDTGQKMDHTDAAREEGRKNTSKKKQGRGGNRGPRRRSR